MIDIHCHLLPGIDDGPDTLDEALELARIAVANGITHSVITPHIHPGRWDNTASTIRTSFNSFRDALNAEAIPLRVGYAAEVRISPEVLQLVDQQSIPFHGEWDGYQVLLLELPHSHVPPGSENLTRWLLDNKIRPMIAHPERNKGIMANIDHITPFIEQGCLIQLTAGAAAGLFGEPARETAVELLNMGCVTVIASDAHNAKYRPPQLDHGCKAAAEIIGAEAAYKMVTEIPLAITSKQFTASEQHAPI